MDQGSQSPKKTKPLVSMILTIYENF